MIRAFILIASLSLAVRANSGTQDTACLIQHNVYVSSKPQVGELSNSAEAVESAATLHATHAVAAAAASEFHKVQAVLRSLSTGSACAQEASELLPRVSSLMTELALLRARMEHIVEASPVCRAPQSAALLAIESSEAEPPWHTGSILDLSTLPGEFHRWHAEQFSQDFGVNWYELDLMSRKQELPLVELQQQRLGCSDGAEPYRLHVQRVEDLPLFPENGEVRQDGLVDGERTIPSVGGISSVANNSTGHSRWDAIMKNGFKQMSNMMKPKDPPKPRSWLLLLIFIFLSLLVIVAMLLVSTPLMTQGIDEDTRTRSSAIQVALPYWMPTTPESTGLSFVVLFGSLIVTALSINFWVGCLFLQILKHTDKKISEKVQRAKIFNSHILQILCVIGTVFAPIAFLLFRKQLSGRWRQWRFLTLKIYLLFEGQILSIVGSYMARMQMNNIAAMDADAFWHCMRTIQLVMMVIGVADNFVSGYVDQLLMLDWRRFLTDHLLSNYMGGHAYYKLNSNSGKDDGADNPDQRMQTDVENFSTSLNSFVFSIIRTVLTLISSTIIVWSIMPKITMILLGYCTCGSLISLLFTWRFVRLNYTIQKLEADYRYSMVHIRDNAEGIAFYGGENQGQGEVSDRFHELLHWKYVMIVWNMSFSAFQFFYTAIGDLLPMILLARMLFQGRIDFGAVGQVGSNFASVMESLSFINRSALLMSNLGTSTNRLTGLLSKIESLQDGAEEIRFHTTTDGTVKVEDLCVQTPDGRPLVQHLSLRFGPARLLVVGRSGVGKSSLLRTLAGLWTQGSGDITMPPKSECMFLPQKPYMPLGTLRKQLCYPAVGHAANDADLRSMLEDLALGDLPDRFEEGFDAVRDWTRVLSLGEQQRLAAIRAMIHQPTFIVLDESTSALSVLDENIVYRRFSDLGMAYISIGHRMSVVKFHEKVLELQEEKGAWKLYSKEEWEQVSEKQES